MLYYGDRKDRSLNLFFSEVFIIALIVDLILIVILVLCVYLGWKNGFIKTLGGFLSYVVSLAIANAMHKLLVPGVQRLPFLRNMITENVAALPIDPEATFFDKMKILLSHMTENVMLNSDTEAAKAIFKNCLSELLAISISFGIIFLIALLVLKTIFFAFDQFVQQLPVIKETNGFFGACAGLLNGFIWTWTASNLFIYLLLPILQRYHSDFFMMEIADSYILALCTKINPVTYLFRLINLFS